MAFGKRPGARQVAGRERRRHKRRPVRGWAQIVFPSNCAVVLCEIVDVSLSGAQLGVASVLGIPSAFVLRLPTGQELEVEVVRRSPRRLGVSYIRR